VYFLDRSWTNRSVLRAIEFFLNSQLTLTFFLAARSCFEIIKLVNFKTLRNTIPQTVYDRIARLLLKIFLKLFLTLDQVSTKVHSVSIAFKAATLYDARS
jgi:hypothetical protein